MSEAPQDPLRALVTGATGGIGRAVAVALARAGHAVLGVGRDPGGLDALAAAGVEPLALDLRDRGALAALGERPFDLLVLNAGVLPALGPFHEADPGDIDAAIDVNLRAPLHLARLVLPGMVARGRGHVVVVGSSAGLRPFPGVAAYGASKAGLSLWCDDLRLDLLGTGVRVSEVAPGRVRTGLYRAALGPEEAEARMYAGMRPLAPEDVAAVVLGIVALPPHVDVSRVELFPTDQAPGGGVMAPPA